MSLSKFHVTRVSLSRFRVTRDNTGCVPRTREVEVRYVQDDGDPVATTVAAADPHEVVPPDQSQQGCMKTAMPLVKISCRRDRRGGT